MKSCHWYWQKKREKKVIFYDISYSWFVHLSHLQHENDWFSEKQCDIPKERRLGSIAKCLQLSRSKPITTAIWACTLVVKFSICQQMITSDVKLSNLPTNEHLSCQVFKLTTLRPGAALPK